MAGPTSARRELTAGVVLLLVAGGYLALTLRYPLGAMADPGPGVFPLAVGLLLLALAVTQVVEARVAVRHRDRAAEAGAAPGGESPSTPSRLPLAMVAALVVYLLTMPWLGFYPASVLLVIFSCRIMGTCGWGRPVLLAAGVLLVCGLVFSFWLKMPLPSGVFRLP